ncbi:hypothetical protein [Brevundimonas sp. M20]|jgi:hypothetical protein|uniref:hypothetical protein n=1 Tax=Brevundimonas sp. M20 TaxID=2591463 RepID=UPI00143DCA83|nr:hypothetical protein [Brevundimonas sp. M20]
MHDDRGARRNRNEGGLWLINALLLAVVVLLSLYVFRAPDSPHDAGVQIADHQPTAY